MPTPTESNSLVDLAYDWLLHEITGFRFRAGHPLSEIKLAKRIGVSRTPLREALQRLEKEGLIKRTETARFTVAGVDRSEVEDARDLLLALDTYVFTKTAEVLDEEGAARLQDALAQLDAAATAGDRAAWSEADLLFHRTANAIAGNRLVADTVRETRRRIHRFWLRSSGTPAALAGYTEGRRQLLEAMLAKDTAAIAPLVRERLDQMRDSILQMIDLIDSAEAMLGDQ